MDGRPRRRQPHRTGDDRGRHRPHLDRRRHVLDAGISTGGVSFVGSDADESVSIINRGQDLAAPSRITTGGGDDSVGLQAYLPASVDLGEGDDSLSFAACHRAYVTLDVSAECLTADGRELSTALAGIESFVGSSVDGLTVRGTDRADHITILARHVLVRSGPGADDVYADGENTVEVVGAAAPTSFSVYAPDGAILRGGWGDDVLDGSAGADTLLGGPGTDMAYGRQGRDLSWPRYIAAGCPDTGFRGSSLALLAPHPPSRRPSCR